MLFVLTMNTYETSATVQAQGDIRLVGVPFAPGTEVDVTVSPKRKPTADFAQAWKLVCDEMRRSALAKTISDDEIQTEINEYRAGR